MKISFWYFDLDDCCQDPEVPQLGIALGDPQFESYTLLTEHVTDEPNIKIQYRYFISPFIKQHHNCDGFTKEELARAVIADVQEIFGDIYFDMSLHSMYLIDGVYYPEIWYRYGIGWTSSIPNWMGKIYN